MAEIQVTDEKGNVHIFPDGSTPEMISKALNVQSPSQSGWSASSVLGGTSPLHQAIDRAAESEPITGLGSVVRNLGAGAVRAIPQMVAHPLNTLGGMAKMVTMDPSNAVGFGMDILKPEEGKTGGELVANIPQAVLAAGGGEGAAKVLDKITPEGGVARVAQTAAGKTATAVGNAAQDSGTGLINKTVGTLKADFKRGANPARGYLNSGNGPALSMQSLAEKGETALDEVGNHLGEAYKAADATGVRIPVDVVAKEMAKPIQKAIDLETGPGGTGNLASIKSYVDQFASAFDKAAQNGGFKPSELFKMKRSIAENTNWSDPAQFNLKAVRQQQTGALSGILSDAIPETADLNQMYQDLTKFTNRAKERANTGSRPLTAHIYKAGMTAAGALAGGLDGHPLLGLAAGALMDSVPAKTALASGLFRGGKALSALGERLTPAESPAVEDVAPNGLSRNGQNYKPNNPQVTPQMLRDAAIQRFLAAQNRQ